MVFTTAAPNSSGVFASSLPQPISTNAPKINENKTFFIFSPANKFTENRTVFCKVKLAIRVAAFTR